MPTTRRTSGARDSEMRKEEGCIRMWGWEPCRGLQDRQQENTEKTSGEYVDLQAGIIVHISKKIESGGTYTRSHPSTVTSHSFA